MNVVLGEKLYELENVQNCVGVEQKIVTWHKGGGRKGGLNGLNGSG